MYIVSPPKILLLYREVGIDSNFFIKTLRQLTFVHVVSVCVCVIVKKKKWPHLLVAPTVGGGVHDRGGSDGVVRQQSSGAGEGWQIQGRREVGRTVVDLAEHRLCKVSKRWEDWLSACPSLLLGSSLQWSSPTSPSPCTRRTACLTMWFAWWPSITPTCWQRPICTWPRYAGATCSSKVEKSRSADATPLTHLSHFPSCRSWRPSPGCRRPSTTSWRPESGRLLCTCTEWETCGRRPSG